MRAAGERGSNTYITCLQHGHNSGKPGLIPDSSRKSKGALLGFRLEIGVRAISLLVG